MQFFGGPTTKNTLCPNLLVVFEVVVAVLVKVFKYVLVFNDIKVVKALLEVLVFYVYYAFNMSYI